MQNNKIIKQMETYISAEICRIMMMAFIISSKSRKNNIELLPSPKCGLSICISSLNTHFKDKETYVQTP